MACGSCIIPTLHDPRIPKPPTIPLEYMEHGVYGGIIRFLGISIFYLIKGTIYPKVLSLWRRERKTLNKSESKILSLKS